MDMINASKIARVGILMVFVACLLAVAGGSGRASSLPTGVPSAGPQVISYWHFDEGAGTTAHDSNGTNDGTFVGTPTWVVGRGINGSALSFSGGGEHINLYDTPTAGTDPFTISVWIKTKSPTQV